MFPDEVFKFLFLFFPSKFIFERLCVQPAQPAPSALSLPTPPSDTSCRLKEEPVGIAGVNARTALDKYLW